MQILKDNYNFGLDAKRHIWCVSRIIYWVVVYYEAMVKDVVAKLGKNVKMIHSKPLMRAAFNPLEIKLGM